MGRVFSFKEAVLALCPVDECSQPHVDRVAELLNQSITKIDIRMDAINTGGLDAALSDAVGAASAERSRAVDAVLREHAESHDVVDYLRTIHRLSCELDGYRAGIRPHISRPDGPNLDQLRIGPPAATLPPDLARMIDQLRDRDTGGRGGVT